MTDDKQKSEAQLERSGQTMGAGDQLIDADSFTALKGVIINLSLKLDELKTKQRELKARVKNVLGNDAQLATFEEQASDAARAFKKRKEELLGSVEAKEAIAKAKEVGEEVKDIEDSLTNHLLNYYQVTGVRSIETPDGDEREFKLNARLLPQKKK